jgi:hypothetical protein
MGRIFKDKESARHWLEVGIRLKSGKEKERLIRELAKLK